MEVLSNGYIMDGVSAEQAAAPDHLLRHAPCSRRKPRQSCAAGERRRHLGARQNHQDLNFAMSQALREGGEKLDRATASYARSASASHAYNQKAFPRKRRASFRSARPKVLRSPPTFALQ